MVLPQHGYISFLLHKATFILTFTEFRPPAKQARQTSSVVYPTTTSGRSRVAPPVTYTPPNQNRNAVKPGKTSEYPQPSTESGHYIDPFRRTFQLDDLTSNI